MSLSEDFSQRLEVMRFPSGREAVEVAFRETRVIQNHHGSGTLRFQLKLDDRVDARVPMGGTPGLHDSLVGD
jgi:hypothetical protein